MKKIGVETIPKKVMELYCDEIHEFIIASGGLTSAHGTKENYWVANLPILGYIDLSTGKQSAEKDVMKFVLTDKEHESSAFFKYFTNGCVYKIKGMLPKDTGDSKTDNIRRMNGLYITEIVEENAQNEFVQSLVDEYNRIVSITSEVFGEMILNKDLGWYEGSGIWMGEKVDVTISAEDADSDISADLEAAEQFFADQQEWDRKIRGFAAEELTDTANDWLADSVDDEDEEPDEITTEDFAGRITIESICFDPEGEFTVYFGDDDMFWGHSVVVYGDIENGPNDAEMAG